MPFVACGICCDRSNIRARAHSLNAYIGQIGDLPGLCIPHPERVIAAAGFYGIRPAFLSILRTMEEERLTKVQSLWLGRTNIGFSIGQANFKPAGNC
jgi:hypothetical protein